MVVAQKVKEADVTEQDSLLLTRNLLRIAIFNISYIRGLFPEKYFNDKDVPALGMKIKKLMSMDAESRRLIDWMEKGVYDALQKKYLKTLLFCICESPEGPMIEEYSFSFSYSSGETDEVSMDISRNKKKGGTFKSNKMEITPSQMRSSACKMIRTLVQLMKTLDCMPDERTILMKLLYYDAITPLDYEPPFFRSCSEEAANITWMKNPLKMEVGNVNSKHILLALKVKSALDPCEDDGNDNEDNDVCLGEDSAQDGSYSSGSEKQPSDDDQLILMPIENGVASDDDTQEPGKDHEGDLALLRDWFASRHTDTTHLADVLSNFPNISVVSIEEIINKLISEGFLTMLGEDVYAINMLKQSKFDMADVKQETDSVETERVLRNYKNEEEDHMYMKALYHALPLEYVTITKLQKKLKGNTSLYTVRKLIDKMALDGFLESKSNGKLGKRVIHSEAAVRKLEEVRRAVEMEMKTNHKAETKINLIEFTSSPGSIQNEESVFGGLHSIGSDITRALGKYTTNKGQTAYEKDKYHSNTTLCKPQPVASRESVALNVQGIQVQNSIQSRSTQEKRMRKSSMVKDPISQLVKRLKIQAAS